MIGRAGAFGDSATLRNRTLRHYLRTPRLLVVAAVQPILFMVIFDAVFRGLFERTHAGSYIEFLVPGILIQSVVFASTQTGVALAEDLSLGVMDRFRSAPIGSHAVLNGRITADVVRNTVTFLLLVATGYVLGFRFGGTIFDVLGIYVLVIAFGMAFSWVQAFLALVTRDVETMQIVGYIWVFPLIFISSAFVPAKTLPAWLHGFARHQPITYAVNTVRSLAHGRAPGDDLLWTIVWIVGFLLVFIPLATHRFSRLA
jgi:ABC-2 type transport system permease protein/oleandomycin transport system permease protein